MRVVSGGQMRRTCIVSLRFRRRKLLEGAACATAIALCAGAEARAQELRLFPASGAGPRYASFFDPGGAAGFRIVPVECSYPWSDTEKSGIGLGIDTPTDASSSEGLTTASVPSQRCVLVQCVRMPGDQEALPERLFTTPVTLWMAAGLLGGASIGALGPIHYGIHGFRFTDEGFFQTWTYGGGADKASHFVASASSTSLLYDAYRLNRLTPDQAFFLSVAAVTVAGALVEVGDGLTPYGFSAQDLTADVLGALGEGLIKRNDLGDLLGFRLGKWLETTIPPAVVGGRPLFGIDYSQEIYAADMKLGGLDTRLHASPDIARFFLLSFVFLTRGYGYEPPLASRYQEVGLELGLNFPEILKAAGVNDATWWGDFLLRTFSFLRIPFTQVGAYYNLKNRNWYGPGAPYRFY
jgi:hypothetical protein